MMSDSLVYEGPLAERVVSIEGLNSFTYLSLAIEGGLIGPFAERLMRQPIAVRAPGQEYIVWALVGVEEQGRHAVRLATFNLAWPRGFAPLTGDLGLAVAWVWSVLDHYGIAYDALATHGIDREALVSHYRAGAPAAIEWGRIADRLGELGCKLPDDLREQPRLIEGTPVDGDGVPVGDRLACDRLAMASRGDDDGLDDEWEGRRWVGELRGPGAVPGGFRRWMASGCWRASSGGRWRRSTRRGWCCRGGRSTGPLSSMGSG